MGYQREGPAGREGLGTIEYLVMPFGGQLPASQRDAQFLLWAAGPDQFLDKNLEQGAEDGPAKNE